ncbi:MAG: tryptophan synthase subunit alpha [Wenzhouxiangellaceae bacterium]
MSRIEQTFERLAASGRTGLIPYITAGDPLPQISVPVMHALADAGADIIELGIPFSDPMADGPVIQRACERALRNGVDLSQVLAMVREFRQRDSETPVVLMGYMNPLERYGADRFVAAAHEAGVDGVLIVDLPPEEARGLRTPLTASAMNEIFLVAPTTTPQRCELIASQASGFIYYVALKGVTGAAHADYSDLAAPIAELRRHSDLPVAVGFGIRDAAGASQVAAVADAVVIGSALVEQLSECTDAASASAAAREFLAPLRQALDQTNQAEQVVNS